MENKRGQVTVYIIIAIIIVAVIIVFLYLYPRVNDMIGGQNERPGFEGCVDKSLKEAIREVEKRGGSINPALFLSYQDEKIEYLCYTNEYYRTCVVQQPLLKTHIEREIKEKINSEVLNCIEALKEEMRGKGYSVESTGQPQLSIELVPNNVIARVSLGTTFTKTNTQAIDKIDVSYRSDLYDFFGVANDLVNYEATYGDSDVVSFMISYPQFKVEKIRIDDGNKVYIITSRATNEKFYFASRSLTFYPGYVFGKTVTP